MISTAYDAIMRSVSNVEELLDLDRALVRRCS